MYLVGIHPSDIVNLICDMVPEMTDDCISETLYSIHGKIIAVLALSTRNREKSLIYVTTT
jgi:hypothetical protein